MTELKIDSLAPAAQQLLKSMSTGYTIGGTDQEGAAALRIEDLDNDIKRLTATNADFTILGLINRKRVTSTAHQYPIKDQIGGSIFESFVSEPSLAPIEDPHFAQKVVNMKYVSQSRQTTMASLIVNNIADLMAQLQEDATMAAGLAIEYGIFYGDSSLSGESATQGLQFDGLAKLIDSKNVLDAAGESLTEKWLNKAAAIIGEAGFGRPTHAFTTVSVQADFDNQQLDRQRALISTPEGVATGFNVRVFNSTRGAIALENSTIMDAADKFVAKPLSKNSPAPATVTGEVVKNAGGKFQEKDVAAQNYRVVVWSNAGRSASTDATATVDAVTSAVKLTVKIPLISASAPQFVEVFRQADDGNYYAITRQGLYQAENDGTQLTLSITDDNSRIPGTSDVFVGSLEPQTTELLELLPLSRIELPQFTNTKAFSTIWMGALALYAPKRWVRITNVAKVHTNV